MNIDTDEITNITQTPSSKPFWKLSSGENGEKYLIFPKNQKHNLNALTSESNSLENGITIKTYKLRWFILLVICLVNISNAINWIGYSAIADFTGQFYSVGYTKVNFLSLVYLIASVPTGLISFLIIDYFGIRSSINVAGWLNFIGSSIRALSSIDKADGDPLVPQDIKYPILMLGQVFCSLAQPFIMFVTTKFANSWFKEGERALANTVALGSNTLGVLIGAFMSPLIVTDTNYNSGFLSQMCQLNLITCGISLVPALLATFITKSNPPTPPSYSALANLRFQNSGASLAINNEDTIQDKISFKQNFSIYISQISKLVNSFHYILLFLSFGIGLGIFNALTTLIEQILCVRGYNDNDAGIFGGVMIVCGLLGSIISGIILDKTKRFEEVAKICFSMAAIANVFFVIIQSYNNDSQIYHSLIIVSFCLIGFFGLPLLPVCMEMSVECVYPIPEETSTGLLFIAGQIFGIVMILAYPRAAREVSPNSNTYVNIQQCTTNNSTMNANLTVLDYTNPLYFQACCMVFIALVFTLFFKCPYLRLRTEQERIAERILNSPSNERH